MVRTTSHYQDADDAWTVIRLATDECPASFPLPEAGGIFPVSVWRGRKQEIIARYKLIGLWLDSGEAIDTLADDLPYVNVIAIDFSQGVDGAGCATARELRQHYRFEGEIRAIGNIRPDQVFYLRSSGFDVLANGIEADSEDISGKLAALPLSGRSIHNCASRRPRPNPASVIDLRNHQRTGAAQSGGTSASLRPQSRIARQ
ncbi:MAG TPA: DUF934 domain-containing protein [Rhodocyclaceae bacterium]|nr:DUF934 domain-containing protein [Rhodocyclaceae bacterium]